MNNTLYKKMVELLETKQIVSIHSSEDSEYFLVGYLIGLDEEYTLLQHINADGRYDGYVMISTADIYRCEYDDEYTNRIEKLYRIRGKKHEDVELEYGNTLIAFMNWTIKKNYVVSIQNEEENINIQGLIKEINAENIVIQVINDNGEYDGITYMDISYITRIDCDSTDEQTLKLLLDENTEDKTYESISAQNCN